VQSSFAVTHSISHVGRFADVMVCPSAAGDPAVERGSARSVGGHDDRRVAEHVGAVIPPEVARPPPHVGLGGLRGSRWGL